MPSSRLFAFVLALWGGLLLFPGEGRSADVDVALVLAVDISNSMDPDERDRAMEDEVNLPRGDHPAWRERLGHPLSAVNGPSPASERSWMLRADHSAFGANRRYATASREVRPRTMADSADAEPKSRNWKAVR